MDQERIKDVVLQYFTKHPQESVDAVLQLVQDAYQEAQDAHVPEYQPLDVKPLARDMSSYQDEVVKKETKGIEDEDLNAPLAGGGYARD